MATLATSFEETAVPSISKIAQRFRTWADALQPKIDHAGRPMTLNSTPKRNKEYQSRLHDCRNLERTQRALLTLADAHENGTILPELAGFTKKNEIERMVHKGIDCGSGGYYSVIESADYADTSEPARILQSMIDGNSAQRAERERLRKIGELEAEIQLSNIPGYFPTPAPVIEIMLRRARLSRLSKGMRILEPEAGSGHIADAIHAAYPELELEVIEPVLRLRKILQLKGYKLVGDDFLQVSTAELGTYNRIIMNPPFERQQDLDHIRKAYSLLAPSGALISVLSPSFEFRNDRKSTEFRAWLQSLNAQWEELPDGSFKASGTGVSTRLLVIERY